MIVKLLSILILVCPAFAMAIENEDLVCPSGSFEVFYGNPLTKGCTLVFNGVVQEDGTVIEPLREAAINRYLARTYIYNITIALNAEYMKRGSAYPVFYHWIGEKTVDDGCEFGEAIDGYCIKFATTKENAQDHFFAGLYAYQLTLLLAEVRETPFEKPCKDLGFKNGNVWKEDADSGPGGVIVLEKKYCDGTSNPNGSLITDFRVEDALGAQAVKTQFRYCNGGNGGRYHHNLLQKGRELGTEPVFVRYTFQGKEECRKVPNPSNSYR